MAAHGGPVLPGQAVTTPSFGIANRTTTISHIIHAVGPVYSGDEARARADLYSAYAGALREAGVHRLTSVAFPQLSTGIFGPTEIRILLAIGNLALLRSPYSTILGHRLLLFDLGGVIASVCMFATAAVTAVQHTAQLYREEPLP